MKVQLLSILLSLASVVMMEAKDKYYVRMADSEMRRNPEGWMLDFSKAPKWNYCHGLELQSILQVWEKTGDKKYFDYAYGYADLMVEQDGQIKTYKPLEYNIDRINSGKMLFSVYAETKEERFKKAIELMRDQMKTHPRTKDGSFWHKKYILTKYGSMVYIWLVPSLRSMRRNSGNRLYMMMQYCRLSMCVNIYTMPKQGCIITDGMKAVSKNGLIL